MAKKASSVFKDASKQQKRKSTRQGMGRGTKFGTKGSKRYKKKSRGQG